MIFTFFRKRRKSERSLINIELIKDFRREKLDGKKKDASSKLGRTKRLLDRKTLFFFYSQHGDFVRNTTVTDASSRRVRAIPRVGGTAQPCTRPTSECPRTPTSSVRLTRRRAAGPDARAPRKTVRVSGVGGRRDVVSGGAVKGRTTPPLVFTRI